MQLTKILATATVAAVLGTAGISIAGAAPSSTSPTGKSEASPAGKSESSAKAHGRKHARRAALNTAATAIGIERAELVAALRDGQTIADVATANDVEPQAVIDALTTAATAKIDAAVAAGTITSARADQMKARLNERIPKLVTTGVKGLNKGANKGAQKAPCAPDEAPGQTP